jgi:hypothetical protein
MERLERSGEATAPRRVTQAPFRSLDMRVWMRHRDDATGRVRMPNGIAATVLERRLGSSAGHREERTAAPYAAPLRVK